MTDLALYNYELDENCYRVRLLLAFLGLKPRLIAVNAFPGGETATPAYRALDLEGRLPLLDDKGVIIAGAPAILTHLALLHDPERRWLPREAAAAAQIHGWLTFLVERLQVATAARAAAIFSSRGDEDALRRQARAALNAMEDHLVHRALESEDWFAGPSPTLADIALFPAFALCRDYGVDHDGFPALRRWSRRFRHLPGFIAMPGIPGYL
jgi:glutathione S-transferase